MRKDERVAMLLRLLLIFAISFAGYSIMVLFYGSYTSLDLTSRIGYDVIWLGILSFAMVVAYWKPLHYFKLLQWKDDYWLSKQGSILPFDKAEHLILAYILTILFLFLIPQFPPYKSFVAAILVGAYWEIIRDGVYTYDGFNKQGASIKDFIADVLGATLALLTHLYLYSFDSLFNL